MPSVVSRHRDIFPQDQVPHSSIYTVPYSRTTQARLTNPHAPWSTAEMEEAAVSLNREQSTSWDQAG